MIYVGANDGMLHAFLGDQRPRGLRLRADAGGEEPQRAADAGLPAPLLRRRPARPCRTSSSAAPGEPTWSAASAAAARACSASTSPIRRARPMRSAGPDRQVGVHRRRRSAHGLPVQHSRSSARPTAATGTRSSAPATTPATSTAATPADGRRRDLHAEDERADRRQRQVDQGCRLHPHRRPGRHCGRPQRHRRRRELRQGRQRHVRHALCRRPEGQPLARRHLPARPPPSGTTAASRPALPAPSVRRHWRSRSRRRRRWPSARTTPARWSSSAPASCSSRPTWRRQAATRRTPSTASGTSRRRPAPAITRTNLMQQKELGQGSEQRLCRRCIRRWRASSSR